MAVDHNRETNIRTLPGATPQRAAKRRGARISGPRMAAFAVIPLLAIPGFLTLAHDDGARAISRKKTFSEVEEHDREATA